jgi:TfoX/Sxy family transcriptional regulator of competence genes
VAVLSAQLLRYGRQVGLLRVVAADRQGLPARLGDRGGRLFDRARDALAARKIPGAPRGHYDGPPHPAELDRDRLPGPSRCAGHYADATRRHVGGSDLPPKAPALIGGAPPTSVPGPAASPSSIGKDGTAPCRRVERPAAASAPPPMPMVLPKASATAVKLFEELTPATPRVTTRKMFGQPAAFVNGNLFFGVFGEQLFVRLSASDRGKAQKIPGFTAFEPLPGRAMSEYLVLPPAIVGNRTQAKQWLACSLRFAGSLPPKKAKSKEK